MRKFAVLFALAAVTVVAGCGSGGTTTIVKETPATTVERTTTVEVPERTAATTPAAASKPRPASTQEAVPDVVGLPLDVAEEMLEEAGYRPAPTNTDTTFGIVVPDNYTVCTQDDPRGSTVVMLAQKYGC